VAEITITVEPIRLESGAWIQHISVNFPDGERSLNVATAHREGSAKQQSPNFRRCSYAWPKLTKKKDAGKARKEPDGFVGPTVALRCTSEPKLPAMAAQ
jgi:hypothetical protein